jgi:hypothetical protein
MIIYLSHWKHHYPVKHLIDGKYLVHLSYDEAFRQKRLHRATYIFTDLDRLSLMDLELAANVYIQLKEGGAHVLNNPALVASRFELLRKLHAEGINDFNAYRPSLSQWPERYPVFLRRDSFHSGALSGLIHDKPSLVEHLNQLENQGVPRANTIAVEFALDPVTEDIYRKRAVFKIGEHFFPTVSVFEKNWSVKLGDKCQIPVHYIDGELSRMDFVPYRNQIHRAFDLAGIDYGRIDFGVYQSNPQFYEINTNPMAIAPYTGDDETLRKCHDILRKNFLAALQELSKNGPPFRKNAIGLHRHRLLEHRREARWRSWSSPTI